jgi:hypothetical protein
MGGACVYMIDTQLNQRYGEMSTHVYLFFLLVSTHFFMDITRDLTKPP